MSAIAGLWHIDGRPDASSDCARMLAAQEIYGPHEGRVWSGGPVALGRRLYRLLDDDAHDRQPLVSRDGRFSLVADLRLDNRDELIGELALSPEWARMSSDADILLECLVRWDEGTLDRLAGDFAFALWNAPERKLLLARDILGQRPLFYHRGKGFFAFASMPKGLHALPQIPYAPNARLAAKLLTLTPDDDPTGVFDGIERVGLGGVVTVTDNAVHRRRWWQPPRAMSRRRRTGDYVEGLRHHLDQATRAQLRGVNGAVGSHLSSGWDSGAVATTAARLLAPSQGKVIAFTAAPGEGYDGPAPSRRLGNEEPLARATASLSPNIEHVILRTGHLSPIEGLDQNFYSLEWPSTNLCNGVWLDAICREAQQRGLRVVLTGQMGNITLSYSGLEALAELLVKGRLVTFAGRALRLLRNGRWRGLAAHALGPFLPAELWQRAYQHFKGNRWNLLEYTALHPDRLAEFDFSRLAQEHGYDPAWRPWRDSVAMRVWALQRIDMGGTYKGVLGGWGVDHRDPTADKRLIEYCLAIPPEEWLADGLPRGLARRALSDRLPAAVLDNRHKGYQAVDWHEGLTAARTSGALMAELDRIEACKIAADLLDIPRLKRLVEHWPTGGWEKPEVMLPYRLALLRGISVGHFLRKATRGNE